MTSAEKEKLRKELDKEKSNDNNQDDFINYLLNGPVYSEEDIKVIEENRKSICSMADGKLMIGSTILIDYTTG